MRFFLAIFLSLQLVSTPVLANLGEKEDFSSRKHLLASVAKVHSQEFSQDTSLILKRLSKEGPRLLMKELLQEMSEKEKNGFNELVKKGLVIKPTFREVSPGQWELRSQSQKISFSLSDFHQGQIFINDKVFVFKGVSFSQLEKALEGYEVGVKTSFVENLLNKTIGVESAYALGPLVILIGVVAALVLGYSVWELKMKPEKTVKRINEIKNKLESDAVTCNAAKSDPDSYEKTFELASSIGGRSSLNSMTSPSSALELLLKEQLEAGPRNDRDCFALMNEAGKKLDLEIPIPSEKQITMREFGSGRMYSEADVSSAVFNLCQAYNALGSCMETFIANHIDDSVGHFKEGAQENYRKYKIKAGRQ